MELDGDGMASALQVNEESDSSKSFVINERGIVLNGARSAPALMRHEARAPTSTCGMIVSGSGGGVPWERPDIVKDGLKVGQGISGHDRDLTFVNLPSYLMAGRYLRPAGRLPTGDDWTWTITFTPPLKLYIVVWDAGRVRIHGRLTSDLNAHLNAAVEEAGFVEEVAPDFHRSDSESHKFKVWSKEFAAGTTSVSITGLRGKLLAGAVSPACGMVTGASGGGVDWHPPVLLNDQTLVNPGDNQFRLLNVPPYLIGGHYIGSRAPPPSGNGSASWALTIKYEPPVKLYIWVWDDTEPRSNTLPYNAGLDEAVLALGWQSEPAPAFRRSDDASHKLEVWSKVLTSGTETVVQPLNGALVAGVVSTEPAAPPAIPPTPAEA